MTRTHDLIRAHVAEGGTVFYVGVPGHPEPEGACGVAPGRVTLVSRLEDVADLPEPTGALLVTNQTTMSQWDIRPVLEAIKKRFPQAYVHTEICLATQVRQEAVAEQAVGVDLLVVVGGPPQQQQSALGGGRSGCCWRARRAGEFRGGIGSGDLTLGWHCGGDFRCEYAHRCDAGSDCLS